jgi:hypothetical protein
MVTMIEVVVFCISWWCGWDDRDRQSFFRKETELLDDNKDSVEPQVKIAKKTKKRSAGDNYPFGRHKFIRFSLLLPIHTSLKKKTPQPQL